MPENVLGLTNDEVEHHIVSSLPYMPKEDVEASPPSSSIQRCPGLPGNNIRHGEERTQVETRPDMSRLRAGGEEVVRCFVVMA